MKNVPSHALLSFGNMSCFVVCFNTQKNSSPHSFFSFAGFLISCIGISLAAARNRGIKAGAALLGAV